MPNQTWTVDCYRCQKAPAVRGKYIYCQACADHLVLEPGENMRGVARYTPHWLVMVVEGHLKMGGISVQGPLVGSSMLDIEDGLWGFALKRADCTRAMIVATPQFLGLSSLNGLRLIVRDEVMVERAHDYERDERGALLSHSRRQSAPDTDELRRMRRVDDCTDPIWRQFGPSLSPGVNPNVVWLCECPQVPAIPLDSGGPK